MPTTSVTIEALSAINRVKWAASGHQLAAGDDDGHIYIYDVGEVCILLGCCFFIEYGSSWETCRMLSAGYRQTFFL